MVGQDLHFDVPRMLDVFFQIDAAVAEGGFGLGLRLAARPTSAPGRWRHAHAASAAAGRGLDQHRKADLVGDRAALRLRLSIRPSLPGTAGTLASRASLRAAFLSPSRAMASGVGPMKSMLQLRQTSLKWAFSERKP